MGLPATDVFTAANGTALATYSPSWTQNQGAMDIQTNAYHPNSLSAYSLAHWNADTFSSEQYSSITVAALTGTFNLGPAVRVAVSGHTGYTFTCNATQVILEKFVAGARTQLNILTFTVNVNDVMRIEITGQAIVGKVNGIVKLTASDTAITSGFAGISGYSNTVTRGDSWEGGNILSSSTHQASRAARTRRRER